MEVWLSELQRLRDPDAHRRELLTHQKRLILGIGGHIRNRITQYRSNQETADGPYPRIECLRDSVGNIWTPPPGDDFALKTKGTETILVPGDELEFIVTASDPYDEPLEYSICVGLHTAVDWTTDNVISLPIEKKHVHEALEIIVYIRSNREYHARGYYDDMAIFYYRVRPPRK